MKILHLNAGNETGGGMHHILLLLNQLPKEGITLGVFEDGELLERAQKLGINTVLFKQKARGDFSIIKQVVEYIKENHINIIHTHGARANLYGVMISRKASCKWITTIHSVPTDDFLGRGIKGKVFTALNIWAIKRADHLFAISERFKEMLKDYRISEEKITTIYNGINFNDISTGSLTRSSIGVLDEDFVMIMVARLEKVKDHVTALQAVKKAALKYSNLKLLLVGDGGEEKSIQQTIHNLDLTHNVIFLGHRNDVKELFTLADTCLLTSRSESFPLVLLEAARANIPVITTDVGGVDKMIPSSEYGWIKPIGNYEEIGKAIEEAIVFKEKDLLHSMGERFGMHCRANYSIANQAKDIHGIYEEISK